MNSFNLELEIILILISSYLWTVGTKNALSFSPVAAGPLTLPEIKNLILYSMSKEFVAKCQPNLKERMSFENRFHLLWRKCKIYHNDNLWILCPCITLYPNKNAFDRYNCLWLCNCKTQIPSKINISIS